MLSGYYKIVLYTSVDYQEVEPRAIDDLGHNDSVNDDDFLFVIVTNFLCHTTMSCFLLQLLEPDDICIQCQQRKACLMHKPCSEKAAFCVDCAKDVKEKQCPHCSLKVEHLYFA